MEHSDHWYSEHWPPYMVAVETRVLCFAHLSSDRSVYPSPSPTTLSVDATHTHSALRCTARNICRCYLKQGTNGKYQELMLQGHLASELEDLLSEEMGIPRRFLTTGFSKGAKPRKAR